MEKADRAGHVDNRGQHQTRWCRPSGPWNWTSMGTRRRRAPPRRRSCCGTHVVVSIEIVRVTCPYLAPSCSRGCPSRCAHGNLKPCREYPAGMTTACDRILRVTATYPVLGYDRTTLEKLCWAKVVPYTNLMDHRPVCALNETASQ